MHEIFEALTGKQGLGLAEIAKRVQHLSQLINDYPKCRYQIMKQYGLTDLLELLQHVEELPAVGVGSLQHPLSEQDAER